PASVAHSRTSACRSSSGSRPWTSPRRDRRPEGARVALPQCPRPCGGHPTSAASCSRPRRPARKQGQQQRRSRDPAQPTWLHAATLPPVGRAFLALLVPAAALLLVHAPGARADDEWLPHPAGASWIYRWNDTAYAPTATREKVTVKSRSGANFVLAWTTSGLENPKDAVSSSGEVDFQETSLGIVNTNWTSDPPPTAFPILCSSTSQCGNSLASTYYNVIWGSRNPVIAEPLLQGIVWAGTGGSQNDVSSLSTYVGNARVSVPAFPHPVVAAEVRTQ